MTAADVVDECHHRGVELAAAGDRLTVRAPPGAVPAALRAALVANKAAVVALLAARCPVCRRPADARGRCWACHDRACGGCGRPTGSAFIATCWPCAQAADRGDRG